MSPPPRTGFHPGSRCRLSWPAAAALLIVCAASAGRDAAAAPIFSSFSVGYPTGSGAASVGMGDLNGDGKQDVVTANATAGTVSVLLGSGDGALGTPVDYPIGTHPNRIYVADFNSDGLADVATWKSGGLFSILLSNGDATLRRVSEIADPGWEPGDVDGDGRLDLVAVTGDTATVRRGSGDGTFGPATHSPLERGVALCAVSDLNRDGRADLVVRYSYDEGNDTFFFLQVMLGSGDGSFTAGAVVAQTSVDWQGDGTRINGAVAGDVSGDGITDLACDMYESCRDCDPGYGATGRTLFGNGDGTFRDVGTGAVRAFMIHDVDGDGVGDVLGNLGGSLEVIAWRPDGSHRSSTLPLVGAVAVAVGDLNGDGRPDMAAASNQDFVMVMIGNGDLTFGSESDHLLNFSPTVVASGDLNGDGRPDLVALSENTNLGGDGYEGPSILLDDGSGTLREVGSFNPGDGFQALALGDLNGDGRLDLATTYGGAAVLMGDGAGGFGPLIQVTNTWVGNLAVGDLNRDGQGDLVLLQSNGIAVLLGHGDGTFDPPSDYPGVFPAANIADLNGDGVPDLALANPNARAVSVMLGDGTGGFGPRADFDIGQASSNLSSADLNGDGNIDLVANNGWLSILLGDGHGGFVLTAQLPSGGNSPVAIGDLNGDGAADVALPMGGSLVKVLLGANDGTFGAPITLGTAATRTSWVGIADRNNDGRADLTVVSSGNMCDEGNDFQSYCGGASVSVLHSNGTPSPTPAPVPTFLASSPSPATIVLGQTFTVTAGVRNDGHTSDNGRLSVSFPSLTDPADAQWVSSTTSGDAPGYAETAAGGLLVDVGCNTVSASYLTAEYIDANWMGPGIERNNLTLTVQPRAAGTFYFYERATMHETGGGACAYVNGVPAAGESGYTDQQGYAVKRFSVTVLPPPTAPAPVFTAPVAVVSDSIGLGESLSISVRVRNDGAASDDGRIVVGFPSLTNPADSALVSSSSTGDSPGYREVPSGEAVSDSACGSVAASYLTVEYADSDWLWLGAETDTLNLTVRPPAVGTFVFEVRSTMHTVGGPPCAFTNAAPSGGKGLDQQGWTVRRYAITVLPAKPAPVFVGNVLVSPSTITAGGTFTLTATVANTGSDTDDGRIVVSFPYYTAVNDTQWVSTSVGGDDTPGYREWPTGSLLQRSNCSSGPASVLSVEYADNAWTGAAAETNQIVVNFHTYKSGTFPIYVRSSMHWAPRGPCAWVDSVPPNLARRVDQQGRPVGVVLVDVRPSLPLVFPSPISVTPPSIVLGESFTIVATARNDGSANDGRLSIAFPGLTDPNDVVSQSAGDSPGYRKYGAGTSIPDSTCHATVAGYLTTEYADSSWGHGESNTLAVTVRPRAAGTFYFDVRSALRDSFIVGNDCPYVNGLPAGGVPVTDQQGWTARRFAVTVSDPGIPLPPPTVAWEQIVVPSGGPGGRSDAAAVIDPGRHALVIFGGQSPTYQGDAWSLSLAGGAWQHLNPSGPKPVPRIMHSMIMDLADKELVIFGGRYDRYLNDVQALPLAAPQQWIPNPGQGDPPSARGGHAAVYDPVRGRMLVIGGDDGVKLNDVWECAPPTAGTWQPLAPGDEAMPGRSQAAAVYDPVRDRVIVIGGDAGALLNDVWSLNLSGDPTWAELHPIGTPPRPRRSHTAIYDPVGDRVIVYGGYDESLHRLGDVWALNLDGEPSWQLLTSRTVPPAGRAGHVAVYDPDGRRMIMYGGFMGAGQYSGEVWALSLDVTTPVAISLATVDVASDLVRLTWSTEAAANLRAAVQRSDAGSDEWVDIGNPTVSDGDRLVFEDRTVVAGARYGYRLMLPDGATAATWVTIPTPAILSLTGASPNPSPNGVAVRFSLPGKDPATLELFDLGGRRVASREVGSLGAGDHLVALSDRMQLSAGVYLIRLTQGGRRLIAKACVLK